MKTHFQRDMERLEQDIIFLGSLVEQSTSKAILALTTRNPALAKEVIGGDDEIDRREVLIEDNCLKVLALHQPVAGDLRYLISAIKVNMLLERMGDLTVNIAERAITLCKLDPLPNAPDVQQLGAEVRGMVKASLEALVKQDADIARQVCKMDDSVDDAHYKIFWEVADIMAAHPETVKRGLHFLVATRSLERIADHAQNIAQDIVFMVEGEVIRHGNKGC